MVRRTLIVFALFAALALAKVYTFSLIETVQAGDVQLARGEYRVDFNGPEVVITDQNGRHIDIRAKVEENEHKFDRTATVTTRENGVRKLQSIEVGGTRNRIVFE